MEKDGKTWIIENYTEGRVELAKPELSFNNSV